MVQVRPQIFLHRLPNAVDYVFTIGWFWYDRADKSVVA